MNKLCRRGHEVIRPIVNPETGDKQCRVCYNLRAKLARTEQRIQVLIAKRDELKKELGR
jgi:hypothetical protein